jgi:hypothetical protein
VATVVGSGTYRYELEQGWGRHLPEGVVLGQTAIVTDDEDRVYLFNRSRHPLIVLDRDGSFITSWGEDVLTSAHGMFIDRDQNVYLPVMFGHAVLKFDREGRELMRLGTLGQASDPNWWGDEDHAANMLEEAILATGGPPPPRDPCLAESPLHVALREPVPEAHPPFTVPTDAAVARNGDIYVTDGYGNARVHRFSPTGELLMSWGSPGTTAPGEFHIPHGVWVDDQDRVIVVDSRNDRIQLFDLDGDYLETWTGFSIPCDVVVDDGGVVFLAEMNLRTPYDGGPFVTILDPEGQVITSWGSPTPRGAHCGSTRRDPST